MACQTLLSCMQVFNSYGVYNMLQAAPGQNITMTWPRTADPDGMPEDGSEFLQVYYWPNATINRGNNFSRSTDPTLAEFMNYPIANLRVSIDVFELGVDSTESNIDACLG